VGKRTEPRSTMKAPLPRRLAGEEVDPADEMAGLHQLLGVPCRRPPASCFDSLVGALRRLTPVVAVYRLLHVAAHRRIASACSNFLIFTEMKCAVVSATSSRMEKICLCSRIAVAPGATAIPDRAAGVFSPACTIGDVAQCLA
jgi:hypothetical protein